MSYQQLNSLSLIHRVATADESKSRKHMKNFTYFDLRFPKVANNIDK